jgi:hypothetical protein
MMAIFLGFGKISLIVLGRLWDRIFGLSGRRETIAFPAVELSQKLLSLLSGSKAAPASSDCLPTFKYKPRRFRGFVIFGP